MLLDPARATPVPWRNGAGVTRELAVTTDTDGATLWRISLADLDGDVPFSQFPGLDRLLLAVGDLSLTIDGTVVDLGPGEQVRFPGEAAVAIRLDEPAQALNVMTRRDAFRADVVLRLAREPVTPGALARVILGDSVADVLLTSSSKVLAHD